MVADQGAGNLDTLALQDLGDLSPHQVLLDERGSTHAVEHGDDGSSGEVTVCQDGLDDLGSDLGGRPQLDGLATGLAMDTDAGLHLVVTEVEGGLAGCRHGAGGEGDAEGAATVIDVLGELEQSVEIAFLLGSGTATSSAMTTDSTRVPTSIEASSAAMSKFMTSPV